MLLMLTVCCLNLFISDNVIVFCFEGMSKLATMPSGGGGGGGSAGGAAAGGDGGAEEKKEEKKQESESESDDDMGFDLFG